MVESADWSDLNAHTERLILVGPLQKNILRQAPGLEGVPQIAVDGGADFAVDPVLWAGDGDSGRIPASVPVFLKTDQNFTDLCFCLEGIRAWDWKELHLFGFLGARKDHELANLGEIHAEFKRRPKFLKAVFYDADDRPHIHFFAAGETKAVLQGRFSVLAIEPAEISIKGKCRYQTDKISLPPLSGRGVSNEAFGEVEISSSRPFFIIVT